MRFLFLLMISLTVHAARNRPNNAVFFKTDYCVCVDGQAVSFGNCASFCSDKNTNGVEVLFANFNYTPDKYFKNVQEWCYKTNIFEVKKPKCALELRDENNNIIEVDVAATANSIKADVSEISYDKTFILTLKEVTTKAKSDSVQLIKFEHDTGIPMGLQVHSHGHFATWSNNNPLFYDNNGNGILDVHDVIRKKSKQYGQTLPSLVTFFTPSPFQPEIGWIMKPWIEQTTYFSYCLNDAHYNSTNAVFKAIGDVLLNAPTEGLYVAVSMENDYDIRYIRESDLKDVWFYLKDGIPKMPTDQTVNKNKIFFHYPLDRVNPYVKKPNQTVYLMKSLQDLGVEVPGAYPAHDRKIGCVPKL